MGCECLLCSSEDEDTMYEGPGTINDAISTEKVDQILIGRMKGIQGHCNSCYMDAALFRSGE